MGMKLAIAVSTAGNPCSLALLCALPIADGTGEPNTDLFIVVMSRQNDFCTNAVAWAFSCFFNQGDNRPIMGFVNICPFFFDNRQFSAPLQTRAATIVHEITHCMVSLDCGQTLCVPVCQCQYLSVHLWASVGICLYMCVSVFHVLST